MRRKRDKKVQILENITITDAGSEGKTVAKVDDLVIFVENAVPGDIVDLQITRKKSSYREARAIKFHHLSEKRIKPVCSHFGVCGGCKWQNMNYADQLFYKQKQVYDNLERLGRVELPAIMPIIASEESLFYRNKLEFTFSNKRWITVEEMKTGADLKKDALGFHIPKMFDKIIDIDKCYLQASPSNEIRDEVKKYAIENNYPFFDIRKKEGLLRNLIIRTASTGEIMVLVSFFYDDIEKRQSLMDHLAEKFPTVTSLLYVINPKGNDTIHDLDIITHKGEGFIFEKMEDLKFKISAKSFYQTNSQQAYNLYKVAREFAAIESDQIVYDLYTGTGTIANFVASKAKKVVGIEYVPEAIEDAKENSEINNIKNTSFFAGDMKDILNDEFLAKNGTPDVVITDPPRAGMHINVIEKLLEINPKRIVYVSCNPATQARDIAYLDAKYRVEKIQPVDMFPHTHHVENVVLLTSRN
ncbi:MAG: 23S rRNA (uracil(1939)-C(5))-methyltransferase RlmD [Bacteroidetes bacterium]|nr:23S rRNA (uracil(1939)-C(5))-methyltransferase RlmD [Bacteroidota bacterium]HET6243556.1 23S rRNA (uracil(1939)-C(5))-methyltransferase RlmD [Bacteroidia bacterium]